MHYNYKEICISCQIYLDFYPRNEEPSWLWMCKHKHMQKMPEWHFLNYFLKNKVLKNLTLIPQRSEGGGVGWGWVWWSPTLIFSEVWRRKTKPNRCVESSSKMRNLHWYPGCEPEISNLGRQAQIGNFWALGSYSEGP